MNKKENEDHWCVERLSERICELQNENTALKRMAKENIGLKKTLRTLKEIKWETTEVTKCDF